MTKTFKKEPAERSVGVVGAGLGGLAAACTLAARGHSVVVFEKNDWVGGKAARLDESGYSFDMGPTILTMPVVLRRIFEEAGRVLDESIELKRLNPQWRCFFDDGLVLDLDDNLSQMQQNLKQLGVGNSDIQGYEKFLSISNRLHKISGRFFFWKSVEDLKDTFDLKDNLKLSTLQDVLALRMGQSVAGLIRSQVKDARVAQMLDHFTQYVGSSPFLSPAVLSAIGDIQMTDGIWYPKGGINTIPSALRDLAIDLGVEFRNRDDVKKILTQDSKVRGVETVSKQQYFFDAVVSNMDALRTYRELLDTSVTGSFKWSRTEPACSGVVLYLGLRKKYPHLLHHNFIFSEDPEAEFDSIYGRGEPAEDPTCYVAAPAVTDPDVAPDGGEALYVLVHTPYLRPHHDWEKIFPEYRAKILAKLSRTAGLDDLGSRIEFESSLTPVDIHNRYRVLNGAIYGLASHGKFMGAFKPGNRSRLVSGLYLCGGAAHPGPGMPMAMMSGWIAADSLDRDLHA